MLGGQQMSARSMRRGSPERSLGCPHQRGQRVKGEHGQSAMNRRRRLRAHSGDRGPSKTRRRRGERRRRGRMKRRRRRRRGEGNSEEEVSDGGRRAAAVRRRREAPDSPADDASPPMMSRRKRGNRWGDEEVLKKRSGTVGDSYTVSRVIPQAHPRHYSELCAPPCIKHRSAPAGPSSEERVKGLRDPDEDAGRGAAQRYRREARRATRSRSMLRRRARTALHQPQ